MFYLSSASVFRLAVPIRIRVGGVVLGDRIHDTPLDGLHSNYLVCYLIVYAVQPVGGPHLSCSYVLTKVDSNSFKLLTSDQGSPY